MVETGQIYCEDCMATMERMEPKSVDIVLTSPPYNTGKHYSSTERSLSRYETRYDVYEDRSADEYISWCISLFNMFDKILAKNGVILWNVSYGTSRDAEALQADVMINCVSDIIRNTPFSIGDKIIWKKSFALPNNVSKNALTRICEDVFVFARKGEMKTYHANKRIVGRRATGQLSFGNIYNFVQAKNSDGTCPLNKATFSSDLVCKLLDIYAYAPNLVVYDPFMGTGTTAIGCEKMLKSLRWIGSEMSKAQCEWSRDRISKFMNQGTLQLFASDDRNAMLYDKKPELGKVDVEPAMVNITADPVLYMTLDLGLIF